jgi:hypothetical protein
MGKKAPQHRANAPTLGANAKGLDRVWARQGIDFEAPQGWTDSRTTKAKARKAEREKMIDECVREIVGAV